MPKLDGRSLLQKIGYPSGCTAQFARICLSAATLISPYLIEIVNELHEAQQIWLMCDGVHAIRRGFTIMLELLNLSALFSSSITSQLSNANRLHCTPRSLEKIESLAFPVYDTYTCMPFSQLRILHILFINHVLQFDTPYNSNRI
jgi:hypothetical protein